MSRGLLDLPSPLLGAVDAGMALIGLPALFRALVWGAIGGVIGMWLYRRYSPQQRIAAARAELRVVQKELADYDGEFGGLRSLVGRQFGLVFKQLRLTFAAALLAGLPVLLILPWLSNAFDARHPESGQVVAICATPVEAATGVRWIGGTVGPADADGCWNVVWPADVAVILMQDSTPLLELPTPVPARQVHRRMGLNWLIGNPAGYLPDASPIQSVSIALPVNELVPFGPPWLRGWEASFFSAALLVSLWLRWRWKLH